MVQDKRISYDDAKRLASHADPQVRRDLATRPDVVPEILFYLAGDPSSEVRQAIASNRATPRRADLKLAEDADDAVRSRLASKIAGILPGLSSEEASKLGDLTCKAIDALARDEATRVRQIVAEAIKDVAHAPPEVIHRLARDAEIVVAGPILEYSAVLTDNDLLEIVSEGPTKGALAAIARRDRLGDMVSDAVARTGDVEAVGVLLSNSSAQIREDTLDWIVERAPSVEAWHGPLVNRPGLPTSAALHIAQFVADSLLKTMVERGEFDAETVIALRTEVRKRLDESSKAPDSTAPAKVASKQTPARVDADSGTGNAVWKKVLGESDSALDAAMRLRQQGALNSLTVLDALSEGDEELVTAALAVMAEVPYGVAERIVAMQSAKGIVALAWRANIPERILAQLQTKLCHVAPDKILKPSKVGEYPMSEDEMAWQLEFFYQLVTKG